MILIHTCIYWTGQLLRHAKMGDVVKRCAHEFPLVEVESSIHPITRTVLRIRLFITADFRLVLLLVAA